jgi:hypothetical protein
VAVVSTLVLWRRGKEAGPEFRFGFSIIACREQPARPLVAAFITLTFP